MSSTSAALAELLRTGAATNGDDPGVARLVRALQTVAEQLRGVDAEYRKGASRSPWWEYYADWFLARQTG